MLDMKFVRENPEIVKQNLRNKFQEEKLPLVDEVIALDEESRKICEEYFAMERTRHEEFHVELCPLSCFWDAEEYHQKYLVKNPGGYCHVSAHEFEQIKALNEK